MKPRNTLLCSDGAVGIPANAAELEIGANLGLVIGRTACRVHRHDALDHVAGYLIMNDISVPHSEYYRTIHSATRARDGFCPLGPVSDRAAVADPDALHIRVYIDTALVQSTGTHELIRPAAQLLEAVTEFMTLSPGDVLGVGVGGAGTAGARRQVATIEIDGLGSLTHRSSEPALDARPSGVLRRDSFGHPRHAVSCDDAERCTGSYSARGWARSSRRSGVWLPPFEAGTIIALGLNYADHAKELAFKSQDEPLVFLKGPGSLLGHRGATRRPTGVDFMHYECELAVVIGAQREEREPR